MAKKKEFAFDRTNFVLLAVGMLIVIVGLVLMSGSSSTVEKFNPDIFSVMRVKVAPTVCLSGYLFMIFAILKRPKGKSEGEVATEGSIEKEEA